MTNEEIERHTGFPGITLSDILNLARADEREKMTEEKIKEYFSGLNGKETALIVLNYLLRGGITDDDLRGLRLQWIKEQPEGVEVWVSWDKHDKYESVPMLNLDEPEEKDVCGFTKYYNSNKIEKTSFNFKIARRLNLSPGECAKFKIVRVGE